MLRKGQPRILMSSLIIRYGPMLFIPFLLSLPAAYAQGSGYSLRFFGSGVNDIDRVKIQIDDPANSVPGPPADVGAEDFTLEFWMKARASENLASAVNCGADINWIFGNIVFDRDRYNQDRKFGLSIAGGVFVFGVSGDGTGNLTICGTTNVLDEQWHHIAVQRRRSDGWMWLYVDGNLEALADGPDGDISYPDAGIPGDFCGGPCTNSDPYLVIGAEKHDAGPQFPSYSGWIDEVRLSNILRYQDNFTPPAGLFTVDVNTVALYHLDEGSGDTVLDISGAPGGPSHGIRQYGGTPPGPEWSTDTPFNDPGSTELCWGLPPTIVGTDRNDILLGTPGDDVIDGRGGNDLIIGGSGNDVICGGAGNDILIGGPGNDVLDGGEGNDICAGRGGADTVARCERIIGVP
jgi:hypothetical protein